jgi:ribosomal protein S27AE
MINNSGKVIFNRLNNSKLPFQKLSILVVNRTNNYCKFCSSFLVSLQNHLFVCGKCGGHETAEDAIVRNVKEFKLLFPERKITTTNIYEWCNVDLTKRTFSRVLKKNFQSFGKTSDSYYI